MNSKLALVFLALTLGGCASVLNDSTHPIKIDTKSQNGDMIIGADCKLTNDYGVVSMKSGETTQIRRSGKDLDIVCKRIDTPDASARAISRANSGMYGNIILGGVVGAIVDHSKGTAYTYPTWVQLVFGKTLIFDRSTEKDGQPALGTEPVGSAITTAAAPLPTTAAVSVIAAPVQATTAPSPSTPAVLPTQSLPATQISQPAAKTGEPLPTGQDSYNVERMSDVRACNSAPRAVPNSRGPGFENYTVTCSNGDVLIVRCEMGNCRVLK